MMTEWKLIFAFNEVKCHYYDKNMLLCYNKGVASHLIMLCD